LGYMLEARIKKVKYTIVAFYLVDIYAYGGEFHFVIKNPGIDNM
jgi:hypothetical protein